MKIVAIGGGDIRTGQTLALDTRIVELSGKKNPRALFLPTASFDAPGYFEFFAEAYAALGSIPEAALLWKGYSPEEIEETIQATKWNETLHTWEFRGDIDQVRQSIERADLVYVGGGNTRRMIELWRSIGVDEMLREAAARGTVLSGVSAGCICWGRYGNSDAALTENLGKPTMRIDCLDFIPLALCPHMSSEEFRLGDFKEMMRDTPGVGIGLDDCCALEVVDGSYRILSCADGAVAHWVTADSYRVLRSGERVGGLED
jgi:dipeptidase E